jgi:hypothetical protein
MKKIVKLIIRSLPEEVNPALQITCKLVDPVP